MEAIERLGAIQCTLDDVACFFSITRPTISKRLREHPELKRAWDYGRAIGKTSLRRLLWDRAKLPNASGVKAAIFLARQLIWCGQDEHLEETISGGNGATRETREPEESLAVLSDEELRVLMEKSERSSTAHSVFLRGDWRAIT